MLPNICWFGVFFWQLLFPLWIYPILLFSSLLPLCPKTSGSLSLKTSPWNSRLSLKIDASAAFASAAFGRIGVFQGLGPSHSNLLATACAIPSVVALRKHIFTGNPDSPPVYFPCELLTWAVGMAVLNIHTWCCWWAALSPRALLCSGLWVWILTVPAEPQPAWVPSSVAMLLKASCGCCSHSRHCCSESCQPPPVLKKWAITTSDCFSCVLQVTYG